MTGGRASRSIERLPADQRRASALRAAVTCLAERGYEAVRFKDVALEAGMSVGLIQHYFGSREQLLEQAFKDASDRLAREWEHIERSTPSAWLRIQALIGHLHAQAADRTGSVTWIELGAAAARHPHLRKTFIDVYDVWAALLRSAVEDGVAAGTFRPAVDVDQAVAMILAHCDGCEFAITAKIPVMTPERLKANTLRLVALLMGVDSGS